MSGYDIFVYFYAMTGQLTANTVHNFIRTDPVRVRILQIGDRSVSVEWIASQVISSYWRLYRNDRDGGVIHFHNQTMPLRRGRLYLIPPWVKFGYHTSRVVRHLYLHFDLVDLPQTVLRNTFDRPLQLPNDLMLRTCCKQLRSNLPTSSSRMIANINLAKTLIHMALHHALEQTTPASLIQWDRFSKAGETLQPAMLLIDHQLDADLKIKVLAKACHLSERHFVRRFTLITGQTPASYVRERRVTMAAQQLATTELSLETIAQRTGLSNRYYLSRVFKAQTGISPAAYRKAAVVDTLRLGSVPEQ